MSGSGHSQAYPASMTPRHSLLPSPRMTLTIGLLASLGAIVMLAAPAGAAAAASPPAGQEPRADTPSRPDLQEEDRSGLEPGGDETPGDDGEEPIWASRTTLDRIGRIVAPVYVNGHGPYRFIVDTGASRSALAPKIVEELGLTPDPETLVALRGVTGAETVSSILVDELRGGELTLERQRLPVVGSSVFAGADGILGTDGFAGMCLRVMFSQNEVSIRENGCPRSRLDWLRVRAKLKFGHLVTVRARIGGTRVTAIVDTGAERSLGNLSLLRALDLDKRTKDPRSLTQVTGATEHSVSGNLVRSPRISVGEVQISNLTVTFGDFDVFRLWELDDKPAILLGMDILGTVDGLMIDYRRREVRFIPPGYSDSLILKLDGQASRLP